MPVDEITKLKDGCWVYMTPLFKRSGTELLIMIIALLFGCAAPQKEVVAEEVEAVSEVPIRDLNEIVEEGKLRVMTIYSSTSYFLYRGQTMGFEYELLERFADYMDLELEIMVASDIDSLLFRLNESKVDLVAHGLTITEERIEQVSFTDYLY